MKARTHHTYNITGKKKDCVVFLLKEESDYIKNHPDEYISIPLPTSSGESTQRMSDLFMDKSLSEMEELISEAEKKTGYNEYARFLCNEALERQGKTPCF